LQLVSYPSLHASFTQFERVSHVVCVLCVSQCWPSWMTLGQTAFAPASPPALEIGHAPTRHRVLPPHD
jgi:hypothetical protein